MERSRSVLPLWSVTRGRALSGLSLSRELAERAVTGMALVSPDCGSAGTGTGDSQVFPPGLLARVHRGQVPGL